MSQSDAGTRKYPSHDHPYVEGARCSGAFWMLSAVLPYSGGAIVRGGRPAVEAAFSELARRAGAVGLDMSRVRHLRVFLTDLSLRPHVDDMCRHWFSDDFPARTVIGVASLSQDSVIALEAMVAEA